MSVNKAAASNLGDQFRLSKTTSSEISSIVSIAERLNVFTSEELHCLHADIDDYLAPDPDPDTMLTLHFEGKVAGFIHYGPLPITDRSMMLFWIFVAPELRSLGVAKSLLDEMERQARSDSCRIMFIETSDNETFAPAKRFYEKNGYKLACIIPDYYGKDHGKAVFSKALASS